MEYDYILSEMNEGKEVSEILIEIRENAGLSRKEFCEKFGIPYRTVQDWELGNRKMPDYLLRLIDYKLKMEQIEKEKLEKEKLEKEKLQAEGGKNEGKK